MDLEITQIRLQSGLHHPIISLQNTKVNIIASMTQHCSHTVAQTLELPENEHVKLAGVVAKMRTIITKAEGKKMASIVLEDFTGQIGAIAFPKTYELMREVLVKDTVVSISGHVMHKEMRGEKTVELRLDKIEPLEGSLDLGGADDSFGTVRVYLPKATESELRQFKRLVDEFPGDYDLMVQILPEDAFLPFYPTQHVNPSETFVRAARDRLTKARIEIVHGDGHAPAAA